MGTLSQIPLVANSTFTSNVAAVLYGRNFVYSGNTLYVMGGAIRSNTGVPGLNVTSSYFTNNRANYWPSTKIVNLVAAYGGKYWVAWFGALTEA